MDYSFDQKLYYTYIVRCADQTLYTGYTTCLAHRIAIHNSGRGAKYTKTRRPVTLVYFELSLSRSAACSREYAIKQKSRKEKEELIKSAPLCSLRGKSFPAAKTMNFQKDGSEQ